MPKAYPEAPDFNPQSEPWRRTSEDNDAEYARRIHALEQNYRTLTRSTAAANKATHLRISKLGGVEIQPGTPINVQVFPYAYFTPNGYPAAGARIYWGDQNDADKYEIWVRRATAPGEPSYGDQQVVAMTQIATADVRGLECSTNYELMIRAVAPGGTYGFFTGTIEFTTPNELTMIPWLGDPILFWHGNFASIQWEWAEDYIPAYEEKTQGSETSGIAPISGTSNSNTGRGVLAPNGKIYYPPGGNFPLVDWDSSRGLVLDPETGTAVYNDYGLPASLYVNSRYGSVGDGVLGDDGIIYWISSWKSRYVSHGDDTNWATVIALDPDTETADFFPVLSGGSWSALAKAANGYIYGVPTDFDDHGFLVIPPYASALSVAVDDLGYTSGSGTTFNAGVQAANGEAWFVPNGFTDHFLRISGTSPIVIVHEVAMTITGGGEFGQNHLFGPVLVEDGSIYAFGPGTSGTSRWYRIQPDGTQTSGSTGIAGNLFFWTSVAGDGRIVGVPNAQTTSYAIFDPEEQTAQTGGMGSGGLWKPRTITTAADGTVYIRTGKSDAPGDASLQDDFFVTVTLETEEIPASGVVEIPNYLKHMQIQRSTETGWTTIGTLAEPGFYMDPFATIGDQYRFVPLSTAGTQGIASAIVDLTG